MFSKYFNHHYYKIIYDFYSDVHYADTHSENASQKKLTLKQNKVRYIMTIAPPSGGALVRIYLYHD